MNKFVLICVIFIASIYSVFAQVPTEHLQLWLRADSVELNSGKISRWYDLSENNYEIIQIDSDSRPVVVSDEYLNSQPVVLFDGVNDYFNGNDILDFTINSHTIFIIASGSYYFISKAAASGLASRWAPGCHRFLYHDNANRDLAFELLDGFNMYLFLNNRGTNENTVYRNSTTVGTASINGSYNLNSDFDCLIGAFGNSSGSTPPSSYLDGKIAEIIVFDTVLSVDDLYIVEDYLMDRYAPSLNLSNDIDIDYGFCDTLLTIDSTFTNILWSTGETNDTIYINQTGEYTVQATNIFGRVEYDTVYVEYPNSNIQNAIVCLDDSVMLNSELIGSYSYIWSDLTTESFNYFENEGDYWVRIEDDNLCFDTVFFSIEIDSFKNEIWLGNDTTLCSGNIIQLIDGEEYCTSFNWIPGNNTEPTQTVSSSGWQKLEVLNINGCEATDSIFVSIVGAAPTPGYIIENLCLGDTTLFIDDSSPLGDISSWKWIINENDTIYTQNAEWVFDNIGTQQIELFVESFAGCSNSVLFNVEVLERPLVSISYTPICSGVEMEFVSEISLPPATTITDIGWYVDDTFIDDEDNLIYTFPSVGEYSIALEVFLSNTCSEFYNVQLDVESAYPSPSGLSLVEPLDDLFICNDNQNLEFSWNSTNDTRFYKLQISDIIDFSNIVFEVETESNSFDAVIDYDNDTLYWRVIAYNHCLDNTVSETRMLNLFCPLDLLNNKLWLKADSVEITGGQVSRWYDLSQNDFSIIQTNVDSRPEISIESDLNNQSVISFDGYDDYLNGNDILDFTTNSHCIFIVGTGKYYFISKAAANSINSRWSPGAHRFFYHDDVNRELTFEYLDGFNMYLFLNNRADNVNKVNRNQIDLGTTTINGSFDFNSDFDFLVGAYGNASGTIPPSSYLEGKIAEIIVFDTLLNETEIYNVSQYLRHKYAPPVNLLYDIRVPYGFCDTAITTAEKPWFTSYEWSTGETDPVISVSRSGLYSVTVTDIFGFESSDDIRVFYPEVNEFTDTLVCLGETLIWDLELAEDYSYEWYGSAETTQSVEISSVGDYAAILTDTLGCQYKTDTIAFTFDEYELTASIGPEDTTLCAGNRLMLISNEDETVDWEWSTTETTSEIVLSSTGEYSVTTTNWRGCEAIDTINVIINGVVPIPAFESLGQCAENEIEFTDLSTSSGGDIISWIWSIEDEAFSTNQSASLPSDAIWLNDIETSEVYEITLAIETDDGCGDFLTQDITVYPLPNISFTPQLLCQYEEIEFVSSSTVNNGSIILNQWIFDEDEQTGSIINYSFDEYGYQTVKLSSTTDRGCVDSAELDIYIKPAELPVFSTENTCLGEEVYFVNETEYNPVAPVQSMQWDFGDESPTSSESSPVHSYETAGTFDASLNVEYANGCQLESTQTVTIYYKPEIELLGLDACLGAEYSPIVNVSTASGSISDYRWEIGNPVIFESVLASPTMIFDQTGSYPLSLTVGNDVSCQKTITDTIHVRENPLAAFSTSRTWGAIPLWVDFINTSEGAESYYWQFDDLSFSEEENPYFVFQDSGTYIVELRSVNEYGCYDTETMTIKSVVPLMDIMLYSLRTEVDDNYLTTSVYVINNGTLPVEELNLDLNLGNGQIYRETIGDFQSGQVLYYTFTFKPYIADGKLPDVVCVEAVDPVYGIYSDIDLSNNTVCNTNVQNLMVFQPYPNPASEQIICEFITDEAEDVEIILVNSLGEIVYKTQYSGNSGYEKSLIDVSQLSQGVYYLQIRSGEEMESFKVEVNR